MKVCENTGMTHLIRFFTAALLALLGACAQTPQPTSSRPGPPAGQSVAAARPTPLILISIDGFRADYLQRGITPVLSALARDGVGVPQGIQPSFPSLTFPNHYTLVTGLTPDHHGIVANTMSDVNIPNVRFTLSDAAVLADRRWWDAATPIWVSAEQQGLKSATLFWPGSEVDIQGRRPSDWRVYNAELPADARVDQVLAWIDRPASTRPDLVTLYFEAVDSAGHHSGPQGAETAAAIAHIDQAIGRLVEGLRARGLLGQTNLVIVADHGMAALSEQRVVVIDELLDTTAVEMLSPSGTVVGFTPRPGKEGAVQQQLSTPHAHVQCWPKTELPERFDYGHNARVPPFICLAQTEWFLSTRESLARNPPRGGAHGFDPADPQMAALFIAHGPAFRAGSELASFTNVNVYPLLAHLIGIRPEPNQGHIETFNQVLLK